MKLILGGPGTGKTTRLLSIVEDQLARGVDPSRIAFVSFTRKAATEAAERAAERFGLERSDLPFFRTLHSLAYSQAGVSHTDVIGHADLREFGNMVGMNFSASATSGMDGPMVAGGDGDRMLQIMAYARATCMSLEAAWHATGEGVEWYTLQYVADSYNHYKQDTFKIDFDDMLDRYVEACNPLPVDVVIIDEAQDLSARQWIVARHAFKNCPDVIVAGDDDQAIYRWSGADVDEFLKLSTTPEVLPVSYRLPREVYNLANSVSGRIAKRYAKHWDCADHDGAVIRSNTNEEFDYGSGSWMVLARSHFYLNQFKRDVEAAGYAYKTSKKSSIDADEVRALELYERVRQGGSVSADGVRHINGYLGNNRIDMTRLEDGQYGAQAFKARGFDPKTPWFNALHAIGDARRQYYQALLRNKVDLHAEPSIYIGTIHSVKGGEADNVVLCTDISYRTRVGFDMAPDDEHRVFYTGLTRTRKNLYILDPMTDESYAL